MLHFKKNHAIMLFTVYLNIRKSVKDEVKK